MGFEIKNICTVVPNPYHPNYKIQDDAFYYFSLFMTPRLQFDGTLKEFYEMLYWPEYSEKIFWKHILDDGKISDSLDKDIHSELFTCSLFSPREGSIKIIKDYEPLRGVLNGMNIIRDTEVKKVTIGLSEISEFLHQAQKVWKKLFHENVPVEAWPIYLKPQINLSNIADISNRLKNASEDLLRLKNLEKNPPPPLPPNVHADTMPIGELIKQKQKEINSLNEAKQKAQSEIKEKNERSKFRQEFHKKISALARYPHVLRVLGLIQDFKVEKSKIERIAGSDLLLRFEIATNIQSTDQENYPFDEFFKSVQFVRPYTKCECNNNDRLRSHFVTPDNENDVAIYGGKNNTPSYNQFVLNGFLRTAKLSDSNSKVFSVDQKYYEDETNNMMETDEIKDPNVVGINTKVFSEEDIAVIKQKAADKPKISKGFSIKVHGQPSGILVNMDEQFQKITDDNIEDAKSAFMAHHLDCGYRVDVCVNYEKEWRSLCEREASYVVDRKDDDWKIPLINFTIRRDDIPLFHNLRDEPWLEEVRQIDEDGKANRFEEIARWHGWSLTCPPLYKNHSADPDNHESDDMELKDITPRKGRLPKLRFGNNYQFRIRTVDICGNGPNLADEQDPSCTFTYVPKDGLTTGYQRLEPIKPPMFFAPYPIVPDFKMISEDEAANEGKAQKHIEDIKNKGGFKIDKKYKGEDNETLVVRSRVNNNKVDYITSDCVRYLTAPHITPHFAEVSGFLDIAFDKPDELYNFLKNVPKHFYTDDEIMHGVPFPTDNLIEEFYINDEPTGVLINSKNELRSKSLKIILRKNSFVYYFPPTKKDVINPKFGRINPGEDKVLTIGSFSKLYRNLVEPIASDKKFRIIHAVQRPFSTSFNGTCINNEISITNSLQFKKRVPDPGSYNAEQKYEVRIELNYDPEKPLKWRNAFFPFSSTGEFILHAEYCDYELNPNNKYGWSYISKDHPKETESDVKENRITSTNNKAEADKFQITKSWSNLDESTEDKYDTLLIDIINPNEPSNPNEKLKSSLQTIKESFSSFSHSIPDTKFRKIKYRLEAVSKFSEFFDIKEHHIDNTDQNPFSVFANLDPDQSEEYDLFGKKSDCYYTIIKNSSKPSKPNITSIVPVFTITNPEENKGTYKFEHKTFRIYLGNTWYETGLGEKIAIIHEQYSNTLKYDKDGNPVLDMKKDNPTELLDSSYVKKKISIFANDPTGSFLEKTDSVINNNEEYIGKTIGSNNIHADSLNTFIFENTVENPSKIPKADQHKKHVFSVFDVHWDMIQKQFYCDIVLNENAITGYTYLLKFAVCRYQEHSIISDGNYDYRLSDVVMTDMISILPSRQIHKNKNGYTVSGREGGRYIFKDGNHSSPIFNRNQLYLISERSHHVNGDLACLSDGKDFYNPKIQPQQIGIQFMPPNEFKTHFIEEYEDIPVQDGFTMDETNYNPRNDPRKRLVFFYKIPN